MKLPIRNYTSTPLTLFIEPHCNQHEIPPGGEAIVILSDGKPHSLDFRPENWVSPCFGAEGAGRGTRMMAYDFERWVANEALSRRNPWLRRVYAAPFFVIPVSLAIELGEGFGSRSLSVVGSLLAVAGLVCAISVVGSPFLRHTWRFSRSRAGTELDERERVVMAEAQAKSYLILVSGMILSLAYAGLAHKMGWWLLGPEDIDVIDAPLIGMIAILPIVIAEWSVPLQSEGEED